VSFILVRIIFFACFSLATALSRTEPIPIALCLEINGHVQRKGNIRTGLIRKGDYIYHGDKLVTSDNGFASIMMIYEHTFIKIYDNSVARILFDKGKKSTNSELALFDGKVIIEMGKDCDHYFILNTPSTIAKVKQTDFLAEYQHEVLFDKLRYSIFTALNGEMSLKNTKSNHLMYLLEGETVVSTLSGKFLRLDTFRSSTSIVNSLLEFR